MIQALTWASVKLFFKKVLVWCKHNWKILAISLWTLFIWIVARKNVESYKKVLDTSIQSYKDELAAVEKTHKDEIEKRDLAVKKYADVIKSIEDSYIQDRESLSDEKRKKIKEMVDDYYNDQESLNQELEKLGFKNVK
jgi:hypothetical protein